MTVGSSTIMKAHNVPKTYSGMYRRMWLDARRALRATAFVGSLSPAVAIEQKNPTKTSRSTVGTATEIYDYLRLLWARVGRTYCKVCGRELRPD